MEKDTRKPAPVLASHLYDFVTCEHRIALDARLERSQRTPPDDETALLFKLGLRFEKRIAGELGYPEVTVESGDWLGAAGRTKELMRSGAEGIYQGVLIEGRCLAQPDFLERVPGRSSFGEFHYTPGDAKSALHARSDAALQVGFAAVLLERMQGVRPERGFLILGDGSKEWFDLGSIGATLVDVMERVAGVADGEEETDAHFSMECARCRWRGVCLPDLQSRQDVSFVFGLTRTRARVLRRYGIRTVEDLARADRERMRRAGAPIDGLEKNRRQAEVLLGGRVVRRGDVEIPDGGGALFLHMEADPLDLGAPFLFCWGSDDAEVHLVRGEDERRRVFLRLLDRLERDVGAPVFHYDSMTVRALEFMGESLSLHPGRLGDLEGRLVDLAPLVRRAAVLPVYFYGFEEVAAVAMNEPRPDPTRPLPSPFLSYNALLLSGEAEEIRERLVEHGRESLRRLAGILRWLQRESGP
jgi:uncharacterized protein